MEAIEERVRELEREKAELQERLEFVEELVGPTEAQRKLYQEQVLAAREAALKAKCHGASLPTKIAGRLDERLLWSRGLTELDAGLLQGGCLPDSDGILQDVSLLGDPKFHPYDDRTGEPRWDACAGALQLSLEEVKKRFGEEIALDVVRCAKELDKYDASRRVGLELPWHPMEDRELEPAEIINLMDRELNLLANLSYVHHDDDDREELIHVDVFRDPTLSPQAHRTLPRRSGKRRTTRGERSTAALSPIPIGPPLRRMSSRDAARRRIYGAVAGNAVVPLPRVDVQQRRGAQGCAIPSFVRPSRMQVQRCSLPYIERSGRIQDGLGFVREADGLGFVREAVWLISVTIIMISALLY